MISQSCLLNMFLNKTLNLDLRVHMQNKERELEYSVDNS